MGRKPDSGSDGHLNRPDLRREIKQAIEHKGWTWNDLLKNSGVSPQTIDKIALDKGTFKGLRSDALLRLCRVLGTSVESSKTWLKWTGHEDYPAEKIAEFLAQPSPRVERPENAPYGSPAADYFAQLVEDLDLNYEILVCTCMLSKPAALTDDQLRNNLIAALKKGLHIAIFCPYPCGDLAARRFQSKPALFEFYSEVLAWTRSLTDTLRDYLPNAQKPQVQGFLVHPEIAADRAYLVPPATMIGAPRPNLVIRLKDGEEPRMDLGSYGRRDRTWQIIHPIPDGSDEEKSQGSRICDYWKDYFKDIVGAWKPANKTEPFPKKTNDWISLDSR
jgi:DNA-binding Xre family transcriptional regulator